MTSPRPASQIAEDALLLCDILLHAMDSRDELHVRAAAALDRLRGELASKKVALRGFDLPRYSKPAQLTVPDEEEI